MVKKRHFDVRCWLLVGMLPLLSTSAGCSLGEALVDGFFGRISDTIATLVSEAALAVALGGAP